VMVAYNVPTPHMDATQAQIETVMHKTATEMRAAQAMLMVVCDGRVASPNVRAFTFTLDGHDFYGLRLGDKETILYDTFSKQWIDWASDPLLFWRVNCAINWVGAQKIGYQYGNTDIVCGDDTWGLLYFLNPKQAYDDFPDDKASLLQQQVPFIRIATAQATANGRDQHPCYAVFLNNDGYGLTANFTPYIMLETSDDQGQSWINHGVITTQPDVNDNNYQWTSLGQYGTPGRLFRVTDNGIIARLDSLEMNDD